MVTLNLGGQDRRLFFDLNAFCRLKQEHGVNILDPGDRNTDDPVTLRALLWSGLIHENPALTVEEVGGWISLGNLSQVAEAFGRAFQEAAARDMELVAANPPMAPSSGMTSSVLATASSG